MGRRLYDLVRSNLHALADRTTESGPPGHSSRIEDLTDTELEAELARRRERREAAERAAATARQRPVDDPGWPPRASGADSRSEGPLGPRDSGRFRRGTSSDGRRSRGAGGRRDAHLAQLYAQLECPFGADLTSVRKHYRRLMRKYHPDLHAGKPEKQRIATELTQRLTSAYNELRRTLTAT